MMRQANATNSTGPSTMPRSRMKDNSSDAGVSPPSSGNRRASNANEMATAACPSSLARLRSPRLRCLETLM